MKHVRGAIALGTLILLSIAIFRPAPTAAQSPDLVSLTREVQALRQQVAALGALIRAHLPPADTGAGAKAAAPTGDVVVSIEGAPRKGEPRARVAVLEFSDYHCPYCSTHARTTMREIEQRYVSTGKVQYVFMDFPIASLHPDAFPAHRAAACAGDQGRYWAMHTQLFEGAAARGSAELTTRARKASIDERAFDDCLTSERHAAAIRDRIALGQKLGVRGTPTFLVGEVNESGQFTARRLIAGAQPFSAFASAIDGVIKEHEIGEKDRRGGGR